MSDVEVRDAVESDWDAIWPFFRSAVRAQETYAYDPATTYEQGRALWMSRPPSRTVVAEAEGRVVGSAKMGPNREGPGAHVGTASFMVDADARGRGVGRMLLEHVVEWHREHGFRGIQFNAVVATNTVAVRLWQSVGFDIIGTVPGAFRHPTHGYVGLHVMHLSLVD